MNQTSKLWEIEILKHEMKAMKMQDQLLINMPNIKKENQNNNKISNSNSKSNRKSNLCSRLVHHSSEKKLRQDHNEADDPKVPKVELTIMPTLEFLNVSVNDVLEKSVDRSVKDSKWKRELKNYIDKKNYVDNKSHSWIWKDDTKFWPLANKAGSLTSRNI